MIKAKMPSVNGLGRDPFARHPSVLPKILRLQVNNIIGLDKYYRSATLLLRQVETPCTFCALVSISLREKGCCSSEYSLYVGMEICGGCNTRSMALQADEYRNMGNDYQLFTMLMRFARYQSSSLLLLHGKVSE